MRKFQQQQKLDVIQSLHILHGQVKDRLNGRDYEIVQTALVDCQEAAIQRRDNRADRGNRNTGDIRIA